jgi:hypothetical protein
MSGSGWLNSRRDGSGRYVAVHRDLHRNLCEPACKGSALATVGSPRRHLSVPDDDERWGAAAPERNRAVTEEAPRVVRSLLSP